MPGDLDELRTVLHLARNRTVNIIAGAAIVVFACNLAAAALSPSTSSIAWFLVSTVIVGVIGCLWYRARVRAFERIVSAVENGASLYGCEVTRVLLNYVVPCGYEVEMWVVDAAQAREHVVLGFWRRRDAERLVSLVQAHLVAGPLPPIEVTLWRPAGRGDKATLPRAKARVRSDDARP